MFWKGMYNEDVEPMTYMEIVQASGDGENKVTIKVKWLTYWYYKRVYLDEFCFLIWYKNASLDPHLAVRAIECLPFMRVTN